ncbi:MAG: flavodoxin family protein [Oscillospiraceae bacterium]
MKVLTILGSPKKNGNSSKALDMFEKNMILQGNEVERRNIVDFKINGCVGCNACFTEKDKPNCVQVDDAVHIFDQIMSSDIIIYASPLYAFSFPAQIKTFIDRHYCFVTNPGLPSQSSVIKDKRVALLITCCDELENNADLIQIMFDRIFKRLECNVIGKYVITSSEALDFIDRAKEITNTMANDITNV